MSTDLDPAKMGAFRHKMAGFMNASGAVLMISVGHRTGLFDTMAAMPAATSAEIADRAGLNERYVREWLAALVAAEVIEYKATADTYLLPPEHAALTTRSAGLSNLAPMAQFIPLLAKVEDQIVDKFQHGGGVPYDEYGDFHRVMGELSGTRFDAHLVDVIIPLVPGLVHELQQGCRLADVGCGSGHAINLMGHAFPHSTFVGFDISDEAIERGRAEAADMGLTNVTFEVRDAAALDLDEEFDHLVTFDAVHDQAHPRAMVAGIHAALKPGGYWLCADICASSHVGENVDHPIGAFMYGVSCMHCMTVSLAYDGEGLGAMWGVQLAREIFAEAGFTDVTVENIKADPSNNYYVCRKDL